VIAMLDSGAGARRVKTSREDAHPIDAGGLTALLFAAMSGDAASARLLLKGGANVNDLAADGNSALAIAAFSGHSDVAAVLLDAGADPNAAGAGYAPLHLAALRGDLRTVQNLLNRGANPNALITQGSPVRRFGSQWALPRTLIGATPLFIAATYLEAEVVRALLAGGASPALALPNGTTPLLAAAGAPVSREVRPSDVVRAGISDSDTPVIPRAESAAVAAAQALLEHGANVNDANAAGDTALHAAAQSGSSSLIQLLVNHGAALDARNKGGQTPLAMTIQRGARGPQEGPMADSQAKVRAAQELLRKLGAKQ
jgi:ankyrin repeat protein